MEKADILKLKEYETKFLPGMLKHLQLSGVEIYPKTEAQKDRHSKFFDEYRRWFYQRPKGIEYMEDVLLEEAIYISPTTIDRVESFHFEQCLECKTQKDLGLSKDAWHYFFLCKQCKKSFTRKSL